MGNSQNMQIVITLITPKPTPAFATEVAEFTMLLPGEVRAPEWLSLHRAADLLLPHGLPTGLEGHLREYADAKGWDIIIQPPVQRRKKLLLADMDSTIVTTETLDDLAAKLGIADKIAPITARAMAGELDFISALNERVALLGGVPLRLLDEIMAEMQLSSGALTLIKTMRHFGTTCVLVSGGFTQVTGEIMRRCGFSAHHGNELEINGTELTGRVIPPILDKDSKRRYLEQYLAELQLEPALSMAVGDGANDIPMLQAAGLGVGYQPKPAVRQAIPNAIIHTDLTTLLYAQGYRDIDFVRE